MAGDLRSSILTTAAVAASVAGLTVIQPLTAAPPLLLAALLMDGGSGDIDGVGGIADAIQGRLLPSDGRGVMINFLTGPFGMWNALDESEGSYGTVPSSALGVASSLPFLNQQGWTVTPPSLPPLTPSLAPAVPPAQVVPAPVVTFDVPSLQIGESIVTPPPQPVPAPGPGDVVTSYKFGLGAYAPVTLLNPITLTNTVAEYLNRALSPVRVNPDGTVTCRAGLSCDDLGVTTERVGDVLYVTFKNPDGSLVKAKVETRNGVTYVTYEDNGALPLVRPLRDYFGLFGNELADIIEPALTALVYWGYRDATDGTSNNLLPTPAETIKAVLDFLVGVKEGIESLFVPHSPAADTTLARAEDAETDEPVADEDDTPSSEPEPTTPAEPSEDPQAEVPPPAEETPAEETPAEEDQQPVAEEPADDDATEETPDGDEPAEDTPATGPKDDQSDDADDKDRDRYNQHRDRDKDKDAGNDKDTDKAKGDKPSADTSSSSEG